MSSFKEAEGFNGDLTYVENEIIKLASKFSPHPLGAAFKQLVEVGGKRIRPMLVVLSFRSLDENTDISYAAPIAVAVELIHTATLIHDDIIDRSSKRRGVETVFKKWGEEAAILAGDLLFSKSFGLVGVHELNELTEVISEACIRLTEGEMLEYRHTGNTAMTEEVYLEIIERKTATLFEACTRCGALLGGGSEEEIEALTKFGGYLGISFQIVDDVLDITADDKFGKPKAIDIREGKVTIGAIHSLRNTKGSDRKALESIIRKKRKSKKDIETASEIIKNSGSIEHAFKRAECFIKKAKKELDVLPDSVAKDRLLRIADSVVSRPF
jgi:geranylgeranyl diphosphate synthase type I